MGINGWELVVLLVVAILVVGPERLPGAAEQLGRVARELRHIATGARDRVREELGPEVADIDLTKFDPRQYDPRRIVREALTEDLEPRTRKSSVGAPTSSSSPSARPTSVASRPRHPATEMDTDAAASAPTADRTNAPQPADSAAAGAPSFDAEATT